MKKVSVKLRNFIMSTNELLLNVLNKVSMNQSKNNCKRIDCSLNGTNYTCWFYDDYLKLASYNIVKNVFTQETLHYNDVAELVIKRMKGKTSSMRKLVINKHIGIPFDFKDIDIVHQFIYKVNQ